MRPSHAIVLLSNSICHPAARAAASATDGFWWHTQL